MAKRPRTIEQLHADSRHVRYELWMLGRLTEILAGFEISGSRPPLEIDNAILEALITHARALIEFLYQDPETAHANLVLATDYNPEWPERRPELSGFLREVRSRADQEISHITRRRATIADDARKWGYGKVAAAVGEVMREFLKLTPAEQFADGIREEMWGRCPDSFVDRRTSTAHPRPSRRSRPRPRWRAARAKKSDIEPARM
jgi:hypothetical protein